MGMEAGNALSLLLPILCLLWLTRSPCGATAHNYSLDGDQTPNERLRKPGTYWPCLAAQLDVL